MKAHLVTSQDISKMSEVFDPPKRRLQKTF